LPGQACETCSHRQHRGRDGIAHQLRRLSCIGGWASACSVTCTTSCLLIFIVLSP
jgi:hypothetical protein